MRIQETPIRGLLEVQCDPVFDERGHFTRTFDRDLLAEVGADMEVVQMSLSHNRLLGTLRGLHWQAAPGREAKFVRVVRGRIFDVAVDLRPNSPTFGAWAGFELSADNGKAIYIPERFAHGFMTLEDDTEVLYQMNEAYQPELTRTLRWDDPELAIEWPIAPRCISPKDARCEDRIAHLRGARTAANAA